MRHVKIQLLRGETADLHQNKDGVQSVILELATKELSPEAAKALEEAFEPQFLGAATQAFDELIVAQAIWLRTR